MTRSGKPRRFLVTYGEHVITFEAVYREHGNRGTLIGYRFQCPKCALGKPFSWIDTESGTHHRITFDGQKATIVASILCRTPQPDGRECGWHVFVTDGVARDT